MTEKLCPKTPPKDCYPQKHDRIGEVAGVILAGGKNSRMGRNKAFLNVNGSRIIDNTIFIYKGIFEEVIIVTNTPEDYIFPGVLTVRDCIQGGGAMGGLYTGLLEAGKKYCFVTACDMPFLSSSLIRYMAAIRGWDIVAPLIMGHYEPLFALYSKDCLGILKNQLAQGGLKIIDIFPKVRLKEITSDEVRMFDDRLLSLININTPEDFIGALKIGPVQG